MYNIQTSEKTRTFSCNNRVIGGGGEGDVSKAPSSIYKLLTIFIIVCILGCFENASFRETPYFPATMFPLRQNDGENYCIKVKSF